ncbi:MAG: hypothetical protein ACRDDX_01550, partial [Cellulosilyticaceae bacterium]
IAKSDLHSHAGRGGKISYIEKYAGVTITPPTRPFASLTEMNSWFNDHIKCHLPVGINNYLKRIEAAFVQATEDNVKVLALSYGIDEVCALGGIDSFISQMNTLHRTYAPKTDFYPDLDIYDHNGLAYLDEIYERNWFNAIDIINYSDSLSLNEMKQLCKQAKSKGLVLKAHIGEYGTADDVMRYAEELELNEIQHGIAAATSPQIMKWLSKNKIKLNVCPTSNIMLGICDSYKTHPIRTLFDYGVKVTLNTDDLLIFNSTLSEEYLHLYNAHLMNGDELYAICQTGLCHSYTRRA